HLAELVPDPVEQLQLRVEVLADRGQVLVGGLAPVLQVGLLGALGLERLELLLELLHALGQRELAVLLDRLALADEVGLEAGQVLLALLLVDPGDEVRGEVDDLLELLGLQLLTGLDAREQVGEPRAGAAQVPDVHRGRGELDVAHALAAHLGAGDLDAAALADDPPEAHALVLAAVALPVLLRAEDLLAEEPVLLGLEGPLVDGLRLLDLAVGPRADRVGRGQPDPELIEEIDVEHLSLASQRPACRRASSSSVPRSGRDRSIPSSSAARKKSSSSSRILISSPVWERTSTLRHSACISLMSTLKLSGMPGSGMFSPLTIAS